MFSSLSLCLLQSISKLLALGTTTEASSSGSSLPTKLNHLQQSLTELNDSDLSDEDLEFEVRYLFYFFLLISCTHLHFYHTMYCLCSILAILHINKNVHVHMYIHVRTKHTFT